MLFSCPGYCEYLRLITDFFIEETQPDTFCEQNGELSDGGRRVGKIEPALALICTSLVPKAHLDWSSWPHLPQAGLSC